MPYIYKIINTENDKVYIGQTIRSLSARFAQHLLDSAKYTGSSIKLYNAIKKMGSDKFSIEPVEECHAENLDEREIFWIEKYDSFRNGYNTTKGGSGKCVIDDLEIIDLWDKGEIVTEISRHTGHACVTVISTLLRNGITHNQMVRRRVKHQKEKVKVHVYQYTLDGDFVAEHESVWDAEMATGINAECIFGVLQNKHYSAGNYQWRRYKADKIEKCKHKYSATNKTVYMYDMNGKYLRFYNSTQEAADDMGLTSSQPIRKVCKGRGKSSAGHLWSYVYYERFPVERGM